MLIRRGITSFFDWDHRGPSPEFPFCEFKRVVHTLENSLDCTLASIKERDVTPNFHSAQLRFPDRTIMLLGHSTYPIMAFVTNSALTGDGRKPVGGHRLCFIDDNEIATQIDRLFPYIIVAESIELNRPFSKTDLEQLDSSELKQIKYWQPETVGQVTFNWWD